MSADTNKHDIQTTIAEIAAGLDGVTPGEWRAMTQEQWDAGFDFFGGEDGEFVFPVDLDKGDAAHISNCSPGRIRALLDHLKAETARADKAEAERYEWRRVVWDLAKPLKCLPSSFPDGNKHVLNAARNIVAERDEAVKALAQIADIGDRHSENMHEAQVQRYSRQAIDIARATLTRMEKSNG